MDKLIAENRKARFDYFLEDDFLAGIVLTGTEIKSIRLGQCSLVDTYVKIMHNEAFVINMHINEYQFGTHYNHQPTRTRKLLLNREEIVKLQRLEIKGYTFIPTKLILKNGRAKLVFYTARGKKKVDKRETLKQRDQERQSRYKD